MSAPSDAARNLDAVPRIALGTYPTPLERLHVPGRTIFVKRDDQLGPLGGGNKTRKLEYLLADARAQGARAVATFGGLQSNHARLTAAAARLLGLDAHLFYFARRPERLEGNLLLADLVGAQMHFLGRGLRGAITVERGARASRAITHRHLGSGAYCIPLGGHGWLGALGYVRAALELDAQASALGLGRATVVVAAGTGGTLAGVLAGLALAGSPLRVLGIDVGALWADFAGSVGRLAGEVCARLGQPLRFAAADVPLIERTYVGRRYGAPTAAGQAAIRAVAASDGVILDPVYTGKAFAALLDLLESGRLPAEEPVIFLHTGGLPGLFAALPPA